MHRRHVLIGGASLLVAPAIAAAAGAAAGAPSADALKRDAAAARAVLPKQTPKAELLQVWTGPYGGVPPWDKVSAPKLREAVLEGIDLQRAEIQAIANNKAAPTFANTLVALEMAGEPLNRALTLFDVMTSNIGSDDYQALETEISPLLSAANDEITFNEALFKRIKAVADGAALDAAGKAELGRINTALTNAFTSFGQKVVGDEKTWTVIPTEAGTAGLPASNKAAAAAAAKARGVQGWAIVNTRSSVDPFLTFANDRGLREQVWRKFVNRGDNKDANDTNAVIAEIVKLRSQRARLLGFEHHAALRMQDTMAKTPAAATDLMNRVWAPAKARVAEEVADMRKIAGHDIEPWDYLYYAEKVRKAKYDLDANELKPYFELNNVKQGAFYMAGRLYGFELTKVPAGSSACSIPTTSPAPASAPAPG